MGAVIDPMDQAPGVLVIRVWREEDHESQFRARVLSVRPAGGTVQVLAVASSTSEVVDVVRSWLDAPRC